MFKKTRFSSCLFSVLTFIPSVYDFPIIQENVADYIKVDQSNYSKYELGKILIHIYPLIEFAKHYKVSIDWLCGKTKDSNITN